MRESDGDFTERRELVLVQDVAEILRVADGAVFFAVFVVEQGAGNRDRDLLTTLREEGRLDAIRYTRELRGVLSATSTSLTLVIAT